MKRLKLLGLWVVCVPASLLILLLMLGKIITNPHKVLIIAAALDRAGNAATNGEPHETVSSRANRAMLEGRAWGCVLCKVLDIFDKNHCVKQGQKKA